MVRGGRMKYLILLTLLFTGCMTLGTRTIMDHGDKTCYNYLGLDYLTIRADNSYRWIVTYTCLDGHKFGRGIN